MNFHTLPGGSWLLGKSWFLKNYKGKEKHGYDMWSQRSGCLKQGNDSCWGVMPQLCVVKSLNKASCSPPTSALGTCSLILDASLYYWTEV